MISHAEAQWMQVSSSTGKGKQRKSKECLEGVGRGVWQKRKGSPWLTICMWVQDCPWLQNILISLLALFACSSTSKQNNQWPWAICSTCAPYSPTAYPMSTIMQSNHSTSRQKARTRAADTTLQAIASWQKSQLAVETSIHASRESVRTFTFWDCLWTRVQSRCSHDTSTHLL